MLDPSQSGSKLYKQSNLIIDIDNFALLAKLLNIKDHLQRQVFKGLLYRKLVVWMDLNIQSDEYVHQCNPPLLSLITFSEVVELMNMIMNFRENLKYVPSKLFFKEVTLDTPGAYTLTLQASNSDDGQAHFGGA